MSARAILALGLLCGGLCLSQASDARPVWPSTTWAGTWRLNPSQSRFSGPAPRAESRTIGLSGNRMSVRSSGVGPSGARTHFHYSVTLDGRFHPLVGNPDGDSIAMRLVSPAKVSIAVRRDGRPSATATMEVSAKRLVMDRRRLKLSGSPSEDVLVYDRAR